MALSDPEIARYARQLLLPGFSVASQELLRGARVHVVGAGDVAGPALLYLAAAGVGQFLVDDPLDVAQEDGTAWLFTRGQIGRPRAFAAEEALGEVNAWTRVRPFATGANPTAVLVCAPNIAITREAAERARAAGLPHVVAMVGGEGGEVVSVPLGAPCYACASRTSVGGGDVPPGTAAALGALGALELLLLLTGGVNAGRRIDFASGQPQARSTQAISGCACSSGHPGAR